MAELRFFIAEAWEYLVRGRGTTFASVVALSAVLFLLSLVLMATWNVRLLADRLEARKGLTVFLAEGVGETRARELEALFLSFGEVAGARFVDREEALAEVEADLGGFPVGATLGTNPLPHSLVLSLTPAAAARTGAIQKLAVEIQETPDVDEVIFGDQWVEALDRNLRTVKTATVTFGLLATAAAFVVLLTTLRLVFLSRRETIRILKVVGATDRFIRSPFLILGGMQCVLAAALALIVLAGVRAFSEALVPGVRFMPPTWLFLFLLGAYILGTIASMVTIEPALRSLETRREDVVR